MAASAHAHQPERLGDPVERPPGERLVADQLEAARLAGEDAREQPDQGARVAAVDRAVWLVQGAQAAARDPQHVAVVGDGYAEAPHGGGRREGVLRAPEASDLALSAGNRREEQRAMGDRLVPRYGEVATDADRRLEAHERQTSSSNAGATMTE